MMCGLGLVMLGLGCSVLCSLWKLVGLWPVLGTLVGRFWGFWGRGIWLRVRFLHTRLIVSGIGPTLHKILSSDTCILYIFYILYIYIHTIKSIQRFLRPTSMCHQSKQVSIKYIFTLFKKT